jgi:hypothetical protein
MLAAANRINVVLDGPESAWRLSGSESQKRTLNDI